MPIDIKELLQQGYIQARFIIEVLGKPKEHVEKAIAQYMEQIKNDTNFKIVKIEIMPAEEKDGMFSTFAEVEMMAPDVSMLIGFCFDYMPSSMEILAPEKVTLRQQDMSDLYNDLIAKLHNVDMVAKGLTAENKFLKKNVGALIQNVLFYIIVSGPKTTAQIAHMAGIPEKETVIYIEKLEKMGKIKKVGDKIEWIKDGNKEQG